MGRQIGGAKPKGKPNSKLIFYVYFIPIVGVSLNRLTNSKI